MKPELLPAVDLRFSGAIQFFRNQSMQLCEALREWKNWGNLNSRNSNLFDDSIFALSEMPLCNFWGRNQHLIPEGFGLVSIEQGLVVLYKQKLLFKSETKIANHSFLFAPGNFGNGLIIDLTFGQFFNQNNNSPGSAIERLKRKAPQNIEIIDPTNGIAMLYGYRRDILKKLLLRYLILA